MGFFKQKHEKLYIGIMLLWLMPANIIFDLPGGWTHFQRQQAGFHFPPDYKLQYLQLNAVSKRQYKLCISNIHQFNQRLGKGKACGQIYVDHADLERNIPHFISKPPSPK
jgi:hypothetical protein